MRQVTPSCSHNSSITSTKQKLNIMCLILIQSMDSFIHGDLIHITSICLFVHSNMSIINCYHQKRSLARENEKEEGRKKNTWNENSILFAVFRYKTTTTIATGIEIEWSDHTWCSIHFQEIFHLNSLIINTEQTELHPTVSNFDDAVEFYGWWYIYTNLHTNTFNANVHNVTMYVPMRIVITQFVSFNSSSVQTVVDSFG